MSSIKGILKYLFCPGCFRDKKKIFSLECVFTDNLPNIFKCNECKRNWGIRALKVELERLEEEIETFEIKSRNEFWNFLEESLKFRNKTLSYLSHSLFDIKRSKFNLLEYFSIKLNKLVS